MLRILTRRWGDRGLVLCCGLLLFALASLRVWAQAPPSADTFVSSAYPTTNYGPSITLVVGSGTSAYLKFNLATLPANASISKATLRLYVDAVAKSGSFDVYRLNNSWSERHGWVRQCRPPQHRRGIRSDRKQLEHGSTDADRTV